MDGVHKQAGTRPAADETAFISYADSSRHMLGPLLRALQEEGVIACLDEKLSDPGREISQATQDRIRQQSLLILPLSRRCKQASWRSAEIEFAQAAGKPVIVLVDERRLQVEHAVPTLLTEQVEAVKRFVSRSKPDAVAVWEFARLFFTDRATAARFRRDGANAWRWKLIEETQTSGMELAFADEAEAAAPGKVSLVEARAEAGMPFVLLGTSDWKRYRLAYSREIRAVVPAPAHPSAPIIGFMYMDFDSGREWARAGEAPVGLQLLGREVRGWHMSEYFWRAFVGNLPRMLGAPRSE